MSMFLITGERRSGTSLVANLLDAQPEVTVYRDFLGIARLHRLVGGPLDRPLSAREQARVLEAYHRQNGLLRLPSEQQQQLDALATMEPGSSWSLVDLYRVVLGNAMGPTDRLVGHKTTMAHAVIEPLLDEVPECRVVYVVRDPRDVVHSALHRFPDERLFGLVAAWRASVDVVLDLEQRRSDLTGRFLRVSYEELVDEPEVTGARLAGFLGLERVDVHAQLKDYGADWGGNSSFAEQSRVVTKRGAARWRQEDPKLGPAVVAIASTEMKRLGYDLHPEPRPLQRGAVQVRRGADWARTGVSTRLRALGRRTRRRLPIASRVS
jgi:hypothetical protein